MGFLAENVILSGPGGCLEFDAGQWCALHMFLMPEPDQYGQPQPGEEWKLPMMSAVYDDERLPVTFSAEQAKAFADALEFYSASIPEAEEIGKVLTSVDMVVDGKMTTYAVTSRKGWVATDDHELLFLEQGKGIIRDTIALLRSGPVTVELAARMDQLGS